MTEWPLCENFPCKADEKPEVQTMSCEQAGSCSCQLNVSTYLVEFGIQNVEMEWNGWKRSGWIADLHDLS